MDTISERCLLLRIFSIFLARKLADCPVKGGEKALSEVLVERETNLSVSRFQINSFRPSRKVQTSS